MPCSQSYALILRLSLHLYAPERWWIHGKKRCSVYPVLSVNI